MEVRAEPHCGTAMQIQRFRYLSHLQKRRALAQESIMAVSAHSQVPSARPPSPIYDERANEVKAASSSAPFSRSKEIFANTDRGDVLALASQPRYQTSGQAKERLTLRLLRGSKDIIAGTDRGNGPREDIIAPAVDSVGSKVPDERATEGKGDSESAKKRKELAEDTRRRTGKRRRVALWHPVKQTRRSTRRVVPTRLSVSKSQPRSVLKAV